MVLQQFQEANKKSPFTHDAVGFIMIEANISWVLTVWQALFQVPSMDYLILCFLSTYFPTLWLRCREVK